MLAMFTGTTIDPNRSFTCEAYPATASRFATPAWEVIAARGRSSIRSATFVAASSDERSFRTTFAA